MKSVVHKNSIRLFAMAILLIPILFQYGVGVSTISLGDVILLVGFVLTFISSRKIFINSSLLVLFVYIFVQAFVLYGCFNYDVPLTAFRYGIYILIIALFPFRYIDSNWLVHSYKVITVFVTAILYIQTIAYRVSGIIIPGVFTNLPLLDESLYDYRWIVIYQNSRRCMSVFAEPSHFAIYVLPCILICLLAEKQRLKNLIIAGFISLGIIMSATFTGVIGLLAVLLLWLWSYFRKGKLGIEVIIVLICVAIIGCIASNKSYAAQYILDGSIARRQSSGRFEGYAYIKTLGIESVPSFLFGHGMYDLGKTSGIYLAGWARMFYYFGALGSIIFLSGILKKCNDYRSIAFLLLMAGLAIGADYIFSPFILVYLLLFSVYNKDVQNE